MSGYFFDFAVQNFFTFCFIYIVKQRLEPYCLHQFENLNEECIFARGVQTNSFSMLCI